jgi:hypothetical protein
MKRSVSVEPEQRHSRNGQVSATNRHAARQSFFDNRESVVLRRRLMAATINLLHECWSG